MLARLDDASRSQVTAVLAPAGAGKTTLLTQWYRHAAAERCVVWWSLDESDDEPQRFFSGLIEAVRSVVPGLGVGQTAGSAVLALHPMVANVVETLGRVSHDLVIVLDGMQELTSASLVRGIDFVLHHAPSPVHWILSGRGLPALNLGPFKLGDQLVTLDAVDLQVDASWILALSRQFSPRPLSGSEVERILQSTEGWLAGVKLALLIVAEPGGADELRRGFSGAHPEVARYLEANVLQMQSPEIREFLIATSVVDRMSAELCNALLGIAHSQSLLEHLERSQLFTRGLDSQALWYQYHPLFLEFLRGCVRRDAARLSVLHERASRWWADHQCPAEALHHAFLAPPTGWRRDLVACCARTWLQNGDVAEVIHWCEKLPHAELTGRDDLCVTYVASLILARRFDDAHVALSEAEAREAAGLPVDRARLRLLQLMLAILSERCSDPDPDAAGNDAWHEPGTDGLLGGILLTLQAYAMLRQNRFDRAWRLAMRARDALERLSPYGFGYASVVASMAERAQGDVKSAARRCEQLFERVRSGPQGPAWVNAATALAHVRYEANRLVDAEALCVEVLPRLSVAATIENVAIAYIMLARIKAINGASTEAFRLLDYLHSVLESGCHRRFLAQVCGEKMRLCLAQDDVPRAEAVAAEFGLPAWVDAQAWQRVRPHDEAWDRFGLAHAGLLLHRKAFTPGRAVLSVLRDSAHAAGHVYREMALEAALATCHWGAGEEDAAFHALGRAFVLSRGYGFPRSVFDETAGLIPVLAAALRQRKLHQLLPSGYLEKFQSLLGGRPVHGAAASKRRSSLPLEPLTDREIDMLKLLAQGLSNQEISLRSQIALSTAKWHLKNVFAKLDVSTRTGALARARALRLID